MRKHNHDNIKTEDSGLLHLRDCINRFYIVKDIKDPDSKKIIIKRDISKLQRKLLYKIAGIDHGKYWRSVDAIILNVKNIDSVKSNKDFFFVEVKATNDTRIKELPYGMFFGFTQNEEELFKNASNYKLCFVHTILKKYYFVTYTEYINLIDSKRIQYQIQLKRDKNK